MLPLSLRANENLGLIFPNDCIKASTPYFQAVSSSLWTLVPILPSSVTLPSRVGFRAQLSGAVRSLLLSLVDTWCRCWHSVLHDQPGRVCRSKSWQGLLGISENEPHPPSPSPTPSLAEGTLGSVPRGCPRKLSPFSWHPCAPTWSPSHPGKAGWGFGIGASSPQLRDPLPPLCGPSPSKRRRQGGSSSSFLLQGRPLGQKSPKDPCWVLPRRLPLILLGRS